LSIKRFFLLIAIAAQAVGYIVLADARYGGQGLAPIYFRVTTMSDIASILYLLLAIGMMIANTIRIEKIGRLAALCIAILSLILLWLDLGIRKTPPDEFTPEAAVAILLAMSALLATLTQFSIVKIFRNMAAIMWIAILAAFTYAFFYPTYSGIEDISNFNPDAGVVLGAAVWRGHGLGDRPSPALRERIDLGYDLLTKKGIPRLVLTGASAPGELAEAEVSKIYLLKRGVDPNQLVEETDSHTTLEQVRYLHDDLFAKQNWSRFVIISDQYHLARVCEMCKFNGLQVIGSPSRIHQPFLDLLYYRMRESVALLEYWMLGR
jgi:uncharacterized SAM-binding protein YcdF (DUF218 family)